jgi:hypothetical protein
MTLSARAIAISGIGFGALLVSISGLLPDARASDMGGASASLRVPGQETHYERVTPLRRDLTAPSAAEVAARELAEQVSEAIRARLVAERRAEEFTDAEVQRVAQEAIARAVETSAAVVADEDRQDVAAAQQQLNNRRSIAILIALLMLL